MGENSAIEWTTHTFNPWWGCVKVSPGCKNCYAETLSNRFNKNIWGLQGDRRFFSDKHWKQPLLWNTRAKKLDVRHKVFCGSMCDVFEDREDLVPLRNRLFDLIFHTPYLDWLLLTKRPENIERMFNAYDPFNEYIFGLHNIWLGTSVENQEQADIRIPELLKLSATVRFLSCEPLLEPIDLRLRNTQETQGLDYDPNYQLVGEFIDWVIVGGESGPNKRPFNPDWARDLRNQCREAVPFFMKQIDKVQSIPDDLMIREFPDITS